MLHTCVICHVVLSDGNDAIDGNFLTLAFTSGGTYEVSLGCTIKGATNKATATVKQVEVTSGTWAGGDAAGNLYLLSQSGNFQSENLNVGANSNVAKIPGDSSAADGYPCLDQIGRASDADGDGEQNLEPMYEWNNRIDYEDNGSYETNGNFVVVSQEASGCIDPSIANHIQKNRDFYNDTQMPGYTSYTYPHPLRKPYPPMNLRIDG